MTQVFFYSGSENKLQTACRLCAKALQQDMDVIIYSPDEALIEQMDGLLWTFSAGSFIPHARTSDDEHIMAMTPIILSNRIHTDDHYKVLLNLDHRPPPRLDQFERVIEIAGDSEDDKLSARERYRFYKDAGFEIQHFKL
ncbi:DNA polymerase III subunit chi [Nitrosomonas sp. JL21]|uniref:DNA polymerase III subunit chi n=1 Tax=Nitrosomonas sp. JL21 TaxID=153949 RepID=UPI00136C4075|nr:DNA polymerase III subunit chi [Nitrosomonas sp. JL21]MBL8496441.1 DNA polymerase III subunit chi [Nitrosomonas sp.]MXS78797.1 DNA polymerase III subunit chi [Nitrosomonas sp. JL21]